MPRRPATDPRNLIQMIHVVVPTFNRADSLRTLFDANPWLADGSQYHVTILDNGSADSTPVVTAALVRAFGNVEVIRFTEHVTAEENVKRAFLLPNRGRLWVFGDRYSVAQRDAALIAERVSAYPNAFLLVAIGDGRVVNSSFPDLHLHSVSTMFERTDILLAASCVSAIIYPEGFAAVADRSLAAHQSPFPHTHILGSALLSGIAVTYVSAARVNNSSSELNWSYGPRWVEIGFEGWFALVDSLIAKGADLSPEAHTAFPRNTTLSSPRETVRRSLLGSLTVSRLAQKSRVLVRGVGLPRFMMFAAASLLPRCPRAARWFR